MKDFSVVGKPLPRVDGVSKATGQAKFTEDLRLPGMLYGKILRSPYPHARIVNIDTSKAEKLAGVKAVVTGKEIGPIRIAYVDTPSLPADEYILAYDKVRYVGEEVAAVAAIEEDIAEEAVRLIKVEYETLPAVFDPQEAMKDGAPKVHDEIIPTTTTAWEDWGARSKARPLKITNNICTSLLINHGDIEKGFAESDYIREDRFYIPATSHAAMEPHVALANFEPSGNLQVWLSHMGYEIKRFWLAKTLGIPLSRVRVLKAYVGGAFGGKIGLFSYEFLAAYFSRKTARPVRITLSREEVFTACRLDFRMIVDLKTGVKKDGSLAAQHIKIINDPGAYRGTSSIVMFLTYAFSVPIYNIPNIKHEAVSVYTNKAFSMPKRGHGGPQIRFAVDTQLDMIAEHLEMDPLDIRKRNIRKKGDTLPNGDRLDSCGLAECIDTAVEASDWRDKKGRLKGRGVGMGIAAMFNGTAFYPFGSAAIVKVNLDGAITLFTGAVEFGQGSDTAMSQIAAEALGVSLDDIVLVSADSELCPHDLGNFLSAGIHVSGEAVRRAADDAKRQMLENASKFLEAPMEQLEVRNRAIYIKGNPQKVISFADVVRHSHMDKGGIFGKGHCKAVSEIKFGATVSRAERFTNAYSFTVAVAEVDVDKETGQVKLLNLTLTDDSGFPINPLNVEGQVEGNASMGQGDVLFEEILNFEGQTLNSTFLDYLLPAALDSPKMKNLHIESPDPKGPYGAKEAGECARAAIIPAMVNAIHDAVGIRIQELPITPEKILMALVQKEAASGRVK